MKKEYVMIKDEALNLALEALDDPSVLNWVNNAKFFGSAE